MKYIKNMSPICETSTSRVLTHITGDDNWAIISPYRSEYTESENKQRMTTLKSKVRLLGCGFIQLVSRWVEDGEAFDEQSLLIPHITYKDAYDLSKNYEQSSFIYKDEDGCREICTNAFERYTPGDEVRVYNINTDHILNIDDAAEIFSKRRGGPASKPLKGGQPFHLAEIYVAEQPRPSYFQTNYHLSKIWQNNN